MHQYNPTLTARMIKGYEKLNEYTHVQIRQAIKKPLSLTAK